MKPRARIDDVARKAGVSTATVSRALSAPDRVRRGTLHRVLAAIEALDYRPDAAASALATGRSYAVGCVVPALDNSVFARMSQALQIALAEAGYQLLLAGHEHDAQKELKLCRLLLRRGVDALIVVGNLRPQEAWDELIGCGKPVLLTWSSDPRLPSVSIDNTGATSLVARHLLDLGHRRIRMIAGPTRTNDRQEARILGVRAVLEAAGLSLPPTDISEQPLTFAGGAAGLRALMTSDARPTAIVCGNDYQATGALLEAQRLGLRVPEQVSICGFDDMPLSAALNPPLTTVCVPAHDMGRVAARCILSLIDGQPVPPETTLPVALVVRASSAPPSKD
jgi:LacI family transcriptional regulator